MPLEYPPPGIPYGEADRLGATKLKRGVGPKRNKNRFVRSVDTCGTIVSGTATRQNIDLLRECLSTLQLPEAPPGTVHPTQDLCASSYVTLPEPWNVYSSVALDLQDSSEKAEGAGDELKMDSDLAAHLPCMYKKIAQDITLF